MKRRLALGAIAACLLAGVPARASAAEIHVMISGGLTAAYRALADGFEREAGHRLLTVYGASMGSTPTAIPVRLGRGEQADVIIVARKALDALVDSGKVRRGSETDLARSPIGMAVRAGTAVPDIRTVEGLRRTCWRPDRSPTPIARAESTSPPNSSNCWASNRWRQRHAGSTERRWPKSWPGARPISAFNR
jgi:ABC-type molybdate transport system substrate-binding protein